MSNYTPSEAKNHFTQAPELPSNAHIPLDLGLDACPWLDDYIEFSKKWSPEGYDLFHIACGLFVLSVIASRRVCTNFGTHHFTNLTLLLTARSSLWAKTTTAKIAKQLIQEADFNHLLLPDFCTPEKMVSMMSLRLPEGYSELSVSEKDKCKRRLALAGQRGWYFDEFGMLFSALSRRDSHMNAFHGILRKLDDTEDTYQSATIGRGEDTIFEPYLSILGITTPADMAKIASAGSPFWNDGFFARYLFAVPPIGDPPMGRFPEGKREISDNLIKPLKEWHERLGLPEIKIHSGNIEVKRTPTILETNTEIRNGIYLYREGLKKLVSQSNLTDLDSNYARLPEFALRISILFASLAGSPFIELNHWARAVGITEEFRKSLHYLYQQVTDHFEDRRGKTNVEKVISAIGKKGALTKREIGQQTGIKASEIEPLLVNLKSDGIIVEFEDGKTVKYRLIP
jgi:hypothetical protein